MREISRNELLISNALMEDFTSQEVYHRFGPNDTCRCHKCTTNHPRSAKLLSR